MKKIVVLIGSRRKGNTFWFASSVLNGLCQEKFSIEYIFPKDYKLNPCSSCHQCFIKGKCVQKDELSLLQEKILASDVFVIASPVYLHYMTGDLKMILDRCVSWAHLMKLEGKPIVVLSTCSSNGESSVIDPLSAIMNWMGGNVIAKLNASQIPNQLNNNLWLEKVSLEITSRIEIFSKISPQSNRYLELTFKALKQSMLSQKNVAGEITEGLGELDYWEKSGLLASSSFKEYLTTKYDKD